jgi:hypothetical protein
MPCKKYKDWAEQLDPAISRGESVPDKEEVFWRGDLPDMDCKFTPLNQQPPTSQTVGRAPLWLLFDVAMFGGTVGLLICYAWARHLGHVDKFCDISSLVEHLPERVLFRLNFSLVGALVAFSSMAIYNLTAARVGGTLP